MTAAGPADATADRLALAVAASLLEQGRAIDGLSRLVTALALAAAPILATVVSPVSVVPTIIVVVLGLLQSWLAVRVGFDAALFGRLAADPGVSTASFDRVMIDLGLLPREKAGRSWAARIAGARQLLLWQGLVLLAQAGSSIGGSMLTLGLWR